MLQCWNDVIEASSSTISEEGPSLPKNHRQSGNRNPTASKRGTDQSNAWRGEDPNGHLSILNPALISLCLKRAVVARGRIHSRIRLLLSEQFQIGMSYTNFNRWCQRRINSCVSVEVKLKGGRRNSVKRCGERVGEPPNGSKSYRGEWVAPKKRLRALDSVRSEQGIGFCRSKRIVVAW